MHSSFDKTAGHCVMSANRLRPLLPSRSDRGDDAHARCMADMTRAAINTEATCAFCISATKQNHDTAT